MHRDTENGREDTLTLTVFGVLNLAFFVLLFLIYLKSEIPTLKYGALFILIVELGGLLITVFTGLFRRSKNPDVSD